MFRLPEQPLSGNDESFREAFDVWDNDARRQLRKSILTCNIAKGIALSDNVSLQFA